MEEGIKMMKLQELAQNLVYNDFFTSVENVIQDWTGKLQTITLSIVIGCLVITGLMFIFGEGPSRAAKKWLIYIVVGALIVWGAATIGQTIYDGSSGF